MIQTVSRDQLRTIRKRFERLYGSRAEKLLERFLMVIGRYGVGSNDAAFADRWDERDRGRITYA